MRETPRWFLLTAVGILATSVAAIILTAQKRRLFAVLVIISIMAAVVMLGADKHRESTVPSAGEIAVEDGRSDFDFQVD